MTGKGNYQVISFDLDGTLTESRQPILQDMCVLLSQLSQKVLVVIISGSSFKNLQVQLGLFLNGGQKEIFKNILLMPANGSETFEYDLSAQKWQLTTFEPMSDEIKKKVIQAFEKVIKLKDFDIPSKSVGPKIEDRITQVSFAALGMDDPIEEKETWDPNEIKRKKIIEYLAPSLPEVSLFIAGTTTIDVLPKGTTKGVMLEKMLEKRGLKRSDLLFIGDALYEGGNDYEVAREGFTTIKTSGPTETALIIEKLLNK
ncbi:MAG: HAD-IIB family hydrolase [Patescibacteria group bacterium]